MDMQENSNNNKCCLQKKEGKVKSKKLKIVVAFGNCLHVVFDDWIIQVNAKIMQFMTLSYIQKHR